MKIRNQLGVFDYHARRVTFTSDDAGVIFYVSVWDTNANPNEYSEALITNAGTDLHTMRLQFQDTVTHLLSQTTTAEIESILKLRKG